MYLSTRKKENTMAEYREQSTVETSERQKLITEFPCFSSLTEDQSEQLAQLMHEMHVVAQEAIVKESDLVDSIYIIVSGEAEVTREARRGKKTIIAPISILLAGEGIGLNDTGFYSTTGKRTATVTAVTDMVLLRLDIKDLYAFLKLNNLEMSMYAASEQMLRMRFIKQSLPFSKLSHERLQWLASRVEEMNIPAGTIIFKQGEQGDKCYLIRSGKVEISSNDETATEHELAILKAPVLFGEATMITHSPRNATAKAIEDCELLVLKHSYLSELIESEDNVAKMFMTLMVDRSRPGQNPHVTLHQRQTADNQDVTILKNPDNGKYFKLSAEGAFIWNHLDGTHTMQEITLELADKFKVFAPDMVAGLISKLTKAGFIINVEIEGVNKAPAKSLVGKITEVARKFLDIRYAFGDSDPWLTRIYNKYISYLFTKPGQIILMFVIALGFVCFVLTTQNVLLFFSFQHASLLLVLTLTPLSLFEVMFHELGHAFAVKAFGREVHYIGVGWFWTAPVAFTDTSDMWLATRKPRMLVNLAGVYVDTLSAGIASLLMFVIPNPYIQGMLWLFALYTYVGAFKMLSPLQELDGYYVLMDWVEKNRLRQSAVIWLVKVFPKSIRHPELFRQHRPEVIYWLSCLVYLILVSILTVMVVGFIAQIMGTKAHPLISLCLPLIVVIISSLGVISDIRKAEE